LYARKKRVKPNMRIKKGFKGIKLPSTKGREWGNTVQRW